MRRTQFDISVRKNINSSRFCHVTNFESSTSGKKMDPNSFSRDIFLQMSDVHYCCGQLVWTKKYRDTTHVDCAQFKNGIELL